MKIIEVRDFSFRYANGSRESLSHVSLDVEEGTFNVPVSYTHLDVYKRQMQMIAM